MGRQMSAATIGDYLKWPYHVEIVTSERADGDSGWVAEVRELRGCIAQGRTREELFKNIERAMTAWIDDAPQAGDPIPAPEPYVRADARSVVLTNPAG